MFEGVLCYINFMIEDIDFLADVDENTPPEVLFKMLLAARRGYFSSLEREVILSNTVAYLKCSVFGKSSEKRKKPDLQLFDEAKASADDLTQDHPLVIATQTLDESVNAVRVNTQEVTQKSKARKPINLNFPRIDVVHDLRDDQKMCVCGCTLTAFGADVTEQLQVVPAYIQVLRHKRLKYSCQSCKEGVKIAPVCSQAISKTLAAPGLLAHVAVAKFDDHLPLNRQAEIWNRLGVNLCRATLSSWVLKMGSALSPLLTHLQAHVCQGDYIKADETPLQVLKTPNKSNTSNSYMWVYCNANTPKPAVVYDYQKTRHGEHAKDFLKGFQGVLQTDGYAGYHTVTSQSGVQGMGCMAHARRKFYDVFQLTKQEGIASKALDMMGKLYAIEAEMKDEAVDVKLKVRQEKSKIILEAFYEWLIQIKGSVQPKGSLDKAITYALNQREHLSYFLRNGRVDIDNNSAERCMKPFAVGRKNWLFMGSPEGAKAGAVLLSLIETAKLNGLNPEGYLTHVLSHKMRQDDPQFIESLMPWNVTLTSEYPPPQTQIDDKIDTSHLK